MVGTFVNAGAIIAGSLAGLIVGRRLPEAISDTVMQGVGLFTVFLGLRMAGGTENPVLVLVSLAVGTVIGSLIDIERRLDGLGQRLKRIAPDAAGATFTQAFVASSLLYCVGPMAVMGAIQDGLTGDWSVLATKSLMDGITSCAYASSLGLGVGFSALPILLYQGAITMLAGTVKPLMTDPVLREMTAVGGILVLGIGWNLAMRARFRIGNMLPAVFVAAAAAFFLAS
ncbi:MAG: DUF554 domain-containing protein [Clostridia bacterium]|nr:DUF554 domain-containing protein [Clostridia bacterium]